MDIVVWNGPSDIMQYQHLQRTQRYRNLYFLYDAYSTRIVLPPCICKVQALWSPDPNPPGFTAQSSFVVTLLHVLHSVIEVVRLK